MRGVHDQAVSSGERERLRATFDEVAELYDRVRPTYPSALFNDLVGLAGLRVGGLLRDGGALRGLEKHHVLPAGGEPFRVDVQEDYDAVAPDPDNRPPGHPDEIADRAAEIDASGLFRNMAARRYVSEVAYSADEY